MKHSKNEYVHLAYRVVLGFFQLPATLDSRTSRHIDELLRSNFLQIVFRFIWTEPNAEKARKLLLRTLLFAEMSQDLQSENPVKYEFLDTPRFPVAR
jgi:hypothetical protein